ncbi:Conserved_hypothetical protein [Hexamita inflata]|uniref:Uncharacterized protein n=1 Tax=Hexamita inflata TaxID=28002 RepID=A0AA86PM77_9EUKA|nr:Conserved hypothetical protein [Hexamita inflata]
MTFLPDSAMLMNVLKLYPDLNLFLQVSQRKIRILNQNYEVLNEVQIVPEDEKAYNHHVFSQGYILAQNGQQYHLVLHKGVVYVQVLNNFYTLQSSTLKHLCEVPSIDGRGSGLRGEIFSMNNQLYAFSDNSFFVFNNNKFKYYKDLPHRSQQHYFCQFNDNVFCIEQYSVSRVLPDLQLEELFEGISELDILCSGGGTIVVNAKRTNQVAVIDMITFEVKAYDEGEQENKQDVKMWEKLQNIIDKAQRKYQALTDSFIGENEPKYHQPRELNEFQKILEFGECGLQLRVELQKQIFGEEFPEKCRVEFEKYMKSQMTEAYIHETIALIKPVREDWKELEEKYTEMAVVEEKEKYLHDCQLLNVMKLAPNLDVYMAVEDGFIHIIDKDRKILHQIKVDFDYYMGKKQSNENQSKYQGLTCNLQQYPVIFAGTIYFQAFNKVYKINSNLQLELVASLPYVDLNYFKDHPQSMFECLDALGINREYQGYYLLNNNKFKFLDLMGSFDFMFVKQNIRWYIETQNVLYSKCVNGNYKEIKLIQDTKGCQQVSFCQSGILIIYSDYCSIVFVIDFINGKYKELHNDMRFCQENIYNHIQLGPAGIQLKDEIIIELFDRDLLDQIKHSYDNYLEQSIQKTPELCNILNSLIESASTSTGIKYDNLNIVKKQDIDQFESRERMQDFQLMNIVKLKSDFDLYLTVEDDYIFIVDSDRNIYEQYQVNYELYSGFVNDKYFNNKKHIFFYGNEVTATICKGEIYIRKFESVFKIHNKSVVFVAAIPGYNCNSKKLFNAGLFCHNDELFAFTHSGNIFKLENDHFVFHSNDDKYFYQFCDKVFTYDYCSNQIQTINNENIFESETCLDFVTNHGGILIFQNVKRESKQKQTFYIIDLTSNTVKEFTDNENLQDFNIKDAARHLGGCGLQIEHQKVIMDDKQRERAEEMYDQYLESLEQQNIWNEQINQLLSFDVMIKYYNKRCIFNKFFAGINNHLTKLQKSVPSQLQNLKDKMNQLQQTFNPVLEHFISLNISNNIQ